MKYVYIKLNLSQVIFLYLDIEDINILVKKFLKKD